MKFHLSLVKATIKQKYYTELTVRGFTILADEPENIGGTNKAPSPIDLMNSALASCTLMYLKNKANKKNIDVGEIKISVKITKNEDGNFHFARELFFQNKISDSEKEVLLNYSNYTPVTKALGYQSSISTKIR
jgi:putative redox protein